ncbi:MAG: ribonuclease J [Candidatus Dormibacteria bacterium]
MTRGPVRVIPLGGLGEIGKNMMAFDYQNQVLVVDAGLMFPEEEMLGVDLVIPDVSYLQQPGKKVCGIVLTHGHEDHVGALPYVLRSIQAPIHGTRLTLALAENKLKEHRLAADATLVEFSPGDRVEIGPFSVEPVHVVHSIPGSVALAITTPQGVVLMTGDYKFDQTPLDGRPPNLGRLAELGSQGVALLMGDSTNASRAGFTPSERVVAEAIDNLMARASGRIIVATFASNVYRVNEVIQSSARHGRKVALVGRSMVNNVETASRLGYIETPENTMIRVSDIDSHPDHQVTLLCTGSQGEPLSALTRIAANDHNQVRLKRGDNVILSATPIPGNEELVHRTVNNLYRNGARVFYSARDNVHASGHGSVEELKLMLNLVRPLNFIPVHGEYRLLAHHAELARDVGIPADHVMVVENGAVLELEDGNVRQVDQLAHGYVFVDGLGIGDVGHAVLRDRKHLSQDGILVVVVTVNSDTGEVTAPPELISRGFVHPESSGQLLEEAGGRVVEAVEKASGAGADWSVAKNAIRSGLSKFLYEQTKRKPMIIPVVVEV